MVGHFCVIFCHNKIENLKRASKGNLYHHSSIGNGFFELASKEKPSYVDVRVCAR